MTTISTKFLDSEPIIQADKFADESIPASALDQLLEPQFFEVVADVMELTPAGEALQTPGQKLGAPYGPTGPTGPTGASGSFPGGQYAGAVLSTDGLSSNGWTKIGAGGIGSVTATRIANSAIDSAYFDRTLEVGSANTIGIATTAGSLSLFGALVLDKFGKLHIGYDNISSINGLPYTSQYAVRDTVSNTWVTFAGPQISGAGVYAMHELGDYVYAGGYISSAGGSAVNNIARKNTTTGTWEALGTGCNLGVYSFASVGTDLYVGGDFTTAGGVTANRIAKYDTLTNTWSALGSGADGIVFALTSVGTDLYAGGTFNSMNGVSNTYAIAKYDTLTGTWSALGAGLDDTVRTLHAVGSKLYAGGQLVTARAYNSNPDLTPLGGIVAWDMVNGGWSKLNQGVNYDTWGVQALTSWDGILFVGGHFYAASGVSNTANIARWNGNAWTPANWLNWNGPLKGFAANDTNIWVIGQFTSPGKYVTRYEPYPVTLTLSPLADGNNPQTMSFTAAKFDLAGIPTYADNAAAVAGGLAAGKLYRTATGDVMVVY